MANKNNVNVHSLREILEKEKLTGANFPNWHCTLRIVLRQERRLRVIDDPILVETAEKATKDEGNAYQKYCDESEDVAYLMLATMSHELQMQLDGMVAKDMIEHLKLRYEGSQRHDRINTIKNLFACKQGDSAPVVPHVHEMLGYIEYLAKLGFSIQDECAIDLILHYLNGRFSNFLMNYVLKEKDSPLSELL